MRITMKTRKEITKVTRQRYQKAPRKENFKRLGEVYEITGWHRKHATRVLNKPAPFKGKPVKIGKEKNDDTIVQANLSKSKYPESAKHIEETKAKGQPSELTIGYQLRPYEDGTKVEIIIVK